MAAPYSPAAIANEFFELASGERKHLTPMQLLKLVYFAHGWYMAVKGVDNPLFQETVEAWQFGPVVPSLFHEFKRFKGSKITTPATVVVGPSGDDPNSFDLESPFVDPMDDDARKLIKWVWRNYGHKTGLQLSDMTHMPGTPWTQTYTEIEKGKTISNELIRKHYFDLYWAMTNGNNSRQRAELVHG